MFLRISTFLLAMTLVLSSLAFANSNLNVESTVSAKITSAQSFKLDGTHPRYLDPLNPDITPPMQTAILNALQKWKGALPIDNTFTITAWANIKSETTDQKTKAKKLDKNTPNSIVVYMWSQTKNPKYNPATTTQYDFESGDPRFVRKEFNVFLKQKKNGTWKAVLEKDTELKTETEEIIENSEDKKVLNDLFGANQTTNEFTQDIAPVDLNSSSQNTSSQISSQSNFSSSNQTNSSKQFLEKIQNIKEINQPKKTTWLEQILNFGSIEVHAGEYDYSWPWRSGQTWNVVTNRNDGKCPVLRGGWHGCGEYSTLDGNGNPSLDLWPQLGMNSDFNIYAPVTGTISRVCRDSENLSFKLGSMRILHASNSGFVGEASVRKGQVIGRFETKNNGTFSGPCGYSFGVHTHIKFIDNGMNVDGQTIYHYSQYNSFTSNNPGFTQPNPQPNPNPNPQPQPQPSTFNRYTTPIASRSNSGLVLNVINENPASQTRINLGNKINNNGQKWGWNPQTKEIKGLNDKCLDGGGMWLKDAANRELRISDCHGANNQKWYADSQGRILSMFDNTCIDSASGNAANSFMYTGTCHGGSNQQWDIWSLGMSVDNNSFTQTISPANDSNFVFEVEGSVTNDSTPVKLKSNTNSNSQKWQFDTTTNQIKGLGNKCLDAGDINNSSNRWLRIFGCHAGTNQKWYIDQDLRIHSLANENLCIDSQSGNTNNSVLYMFTCHGNANQKWNKNNFSIQSRNWNLQPQSSSSSSSSPTPSSSATPPSSGDKWIFKKTDSNLCLAGNVNSGDAPSSVENCNSNFVAQKWEAYLFNGAAFLRRSLTNKCLASNAPATGTTVFVLNCNNQSPSQGWSYDWNTKLLSKNGSNQCLARHLPAGSSQVYTWQCNSSDQAQKWDAIRTN
jgi:hypothetical protein